MEEEEKRLKLLQRLEASQAKVERQLLKIKNLEHAKHVNEEVGASEITDILDENIALKKAITKDRNYIKELTDTFSAKVKEIKEIKAEHTEE